MIRQSTLYYLAAILVFSFTMYGGHGMASENNTHALTVMDRGLFVIANGYPDNSSIPALSGVVMNGLVAGQWGNRYEVTVTDNALHALNLRAYDRHGTADEVLQLNVNFTIGGNVTVLLGLGTTELDGLYTEISSA